MKVTYPYTDEVERILNQLYYYKEKDLDQAITLHRRKKIAEARSSILPVDIIGLPPKWENVELDYMKPGGDPVYKKASFQSVQKRAAYDWLKQSIEHMLNKWDHLIEWYNSDTPYNMGRVLNYSGENELDIYGIPKSSSKLVSTNYGGIVNYHFSPNFIDTANILEYLGRGDSYQTKKINAETPRDAAKQALHQEMESLASKLINLVKERSYQDSFVQRRNIIVFEPERGHYNLLKKREEENKNKSSWAFSGHGSGWGEL